MQGIVLDDTNTQMIKPISSYMDILDLDKVYRLEEILTVLHDQKDILTEPETIHQNLDPEKPNIELG